MSASDPVTQRVKDPTISVVIPFGNAAAHLPACLSAVAGSRPAPCELILVDDASSDGSSAIAAGSGAKVMTLPRRRGPAFARNRGAETASGEILFFIDADVLCHPDTIARVAEAFSKDAGLSAVIGSYDDDPPVRTFLSRYKNLTHHFVHQQASTQASTFWTGCGGVRRGVFREMGGFDESYGRPSIEDIELGYRMRAAGHRIELRKDLLVTHAKAWTVRSLLQSDIFDRAIPWTALQLQYGALLNDLNVSTGQRVAALLAWAAATASGAGFILPSLWFAAAVAELGIIAINRRQYRFYHHKGGLIFASGCAIMHLLYYLYSSVAFCAGCLLYLRRRAAPAAPGHQAGRIL
jgi:GT2 family glycosyltransferase